MSVLFDVVSSELVCSRNVSVEFLERPAQPAQVTRLRFVFLVVCKCRAMIVVKFQCATL